ncbi:hypothetical protein PM082_019860 [Marasmius tenuissimus]|nr:hypothetical protein PM082_019860 [Marasmius tenuissimus]
MVFGYDSVTGPYPNLHIGAPPSGVSGRPSLIGLCSKLLPASARTTRAPKRPRMCRGLRVGGTGRDWKGEAAGPLERHGATTTRILVAAIMPTTLRLQKQRTGVNSRVSALLVTAFQNIIIHQRLPSGLDHQHHLPHSR